MGFPRWIALVTGRHRSQSHASWSQHVHSHVLYWVIIKLYPIQQPSRERHMFFMNIYVIYDPQSQWIIVSIFITIVIWTGYTRFSQTQMNEYAIGSPWLNNAWNPISRIVHSYHEVYMPCDNHHEKHLYRYSYFYLFLCVYIYIHIYTLYITYVRLYIHT